MSTAGGTAPELAQLSWDRTDVLVVVVTYRAGPALDRCLVGLAAQRPLPGAEAPRTAVLVVDNGDEPLVLGAAAPAGTVVVRPGTNTGFATGANVGLRAAVAAWRRSAWPDGLVVLVNDDAVAGPGFVAAMWQAHRETDRTVGAFTGLLLLASPAGTVNSTGTVLTRRGSARDRDLGRPASDGPAPAEVFGFCGGAAALRPWALGEVGVLADDWFLYYEDVDLSWRLRAAGLSVRHVPGAVVVHELAASSGVTSPVFRYHNDRNSLSTFTRHAPWPTVVRVWARFPLAVLAHTLRPATRRLVPHRLRALRDAARRLPRTLAERRRIWAAAPGRRQEVARRWLDREG